MKTYGTFFKNYTFYSVPLPPFLIVCWSLVAPFFSQRINYFHMHFMRQVVYNKLEAIYFNLCPVSNWCELNKLALIIFRIWGRWKNKYPDSNLACLSYSKTPLETHNWHVTWSATEDGRRETKVVNGNPKNIFFSFILLFFSTFREWSKLTNQCII